MLVLPVSTHTVHVHMMCDVREESSNSSSNPATIEPPRKRLCTATRHTSEEVQRLHKLAHMLDADVWNQVNWNNAPCHHRHFVQRCVLGPG